MPTPVSDSRPAAPLISRRNLILLGVAVATIVAGYVVLSNGAAETASVLLVIGYCVLFPLALVA